MLHIGNNLSCKKSFEKSLSRCLYFSWSTYAKTTMKENHFFLTFIVIVRGYWQCVKNWSVLYFPHHNGSNILKVRQNEGFTLFPIEKYFTYSLYYKNKDVIWLLLEWSGVSYHLGSDIIPLGLFHTTQNADFTPIPRHFIVYLGPHARPL